MPNVDLDERRVSLQPDAVQRIAGTVEYDHLVLALGSVSNFFGQSHIERIAPDFNRLTDAIRTRNAVIANFERADRESDPPIRSTAAPHVRGRRGRFRRATERRTRK